MLRLCFVFIVNIAILTSLAHQSLPLPYHQPTNYASKQRTNYQLRTFTTPHHGAPHRTSGVSRHPEGHRGHRRARRRGGPDQGQHPGGDQPDGGADQPRVQEQAGAVAAPYCRAEGMICTLPLLLPLSLCLSRRGLLHILSLFILAIFSGSFMIPRRSSNS
jgi:hypothetical protein